MEIVFVFITSPAGAVAKYCDECVCVRVCNVAYGRGSVILWRRCDTSITSSFVDDIMFVSIMDYIAV